MMREQTRSTFLPYTTLFRSKDQQTVLRIEPTTLEPLGKNRRTAIVVGACGQFGNIVRRRVGLKAADFAEVVHGMAGVARAAANAEDEQPPTLFADAGQL